MSLRSNFFALGLGLGLGVVLLQASAQDLEFSVSPSPVGSGARAAGMADAFVAIADDATAASWNPAGLVQLEIPEISVVWAYNGLWERFGSGNHPEVDSWHDDHNLDLNYLSLVFPFPRPVFGKNATLALNYQRKYDFSRDFRFDYHPVGNLGMGGIASGLPTLSFYDFAFEQSGGLSTITPALGFELTHRLSLGVAVNLWRSSPFGDNSWEQRTDVRTTSFTSGGAMIWGRSKTKEEYRDFSGENVSIGLLWNIRDAWSIGARYDSSFSGDADYRRRGYAMSLIPSSGFLSVTPHWTKEKRKVRFPSSFALGVAHRFSDRFTMSMDVTRTDWNDFYVKDASGIRYSLINAQKLDTFFTSPSFRSTYTVRLGGEYVFIPEYPGEELDRLWSVRGGVFYDQQPASKRPDDFWGLALGVGLLMNNRVNVDMAYQFRCGRDVNADFVRGVRGFSEDVYQHRVLMSTVIYF